MRAGSNLLSKPHLIEHRHVSFIIFHITDTGKQSFHYRPIYTLHFYTRILDNRHNYRYSKSVVLIRID